MGNILCISRDFVRLTGRRGIMGSTPAKDESSKEQLDVVAVET